jgi:hypothetical protein
MENLFLFDFATPIWLFLRLLSIIGISAVLIWLIHTILMRFLYRQENDSFTLVWKFSILKSLIIFVLCFSVYLFFLIKINGLHWFLWSQFPFSIINIYFLLAPELLVLLGIISLFYFQKSQIKKLIK